MAVKVELEDTEWVEVQLVGWWPGKRESAIQWAKDTFGESNVDTALQGNFIYFNSESDASMFVLRWG